MQPVPFDAETASVVQAALWGLMIISVLLTLRAIDSGTWGTMWVAALGSLAASLIAIWSIGPLLFLLTCLQLAAAVAMRRSVGWRGWMVFLLAGIGAYAVIIFGLAFARAWDVWLIALPSGFALVSLLLLTEPRLRRG